PLEIAIGKADLDKWARLDGRHLLVQDETMDFLKSNLIASYHRWYKDNRGGHMTSTYLLFTESAYARLEPLDKKRCQLITDGVGAQKRAFFVASVEKFQSRIRNSEFLAVIDLPGSRLYDHIDEVYVPPIEYEDMV